MTAKNVLVVAAATMIMMIRFAPNAKVTAHIGTCHAICATGREGFGDYLRQQWVKNGISPSGVGGCQPWQREAVKQRIWDKGGDMKHTPGPWHVVQGDEWTSDIATDTPEQGVWTVASVNKRRDEFEANKRLIAAAPELLEVLKSALKTAEFQKDPFRPWHEEARRAITKATTK